MIETAPRPAFKLGFGGGLCLGLFFGGGCRTSMRFASGVSFDGAGRLRPGSPARSVLGTCVGGRVGRGRVRGADPIGGAVSNMGGVPLGLGAPVDPRPWIGGRSASSVAVTVSPMGSSVILVHPSRHTPEPLPSRSTKAGIDVMPNLVISDCPRIPIKSI